ncbi:alpha/beta hydrolase [Streptomyces sp. RerS4]|uniref:alpha/beta fold hydrolase n=1 Tax=Streptomyces sp. RerS4 TaxID=2942449 RepID=UPI00201C0D4F|nr:alpha/beta hydrolase [Streptomyces sp. RerS4]UQX02205.1 alpha/beta hydrolase [Streptomyces sp. RerS4]
MRHTLTIDGRALSYLDFGGPGRPLLALHGGLSEGGAYTGLAAALGDRWRVIAPDQRGHGDSDRAPHYRTEGYVADAVALLDHLGLDAPVVVLGFSLGGVNAYHLAAEHPDRVAALIDVDAAVEFPLHDDGPAVPADFRFLTEMRYTAATREELLQAAGPIGSQFVAQALRPLPDGDGWRLPFHPEDAIASATGVQGDHWDAWLASTCPAVLVHGTRSAVLPQATADAMVARRPGTSYIPVEGDHYIPFTAPDAFHAAVGKFLADL